MPMRSVLALTLGAAVAEAFMLSNGGVAAPALRARAPQVAAQSVPAGLVSRAAATPKARARLALRMSGLPAPADRPSPFEPDSDMARGARIPDGAYEELSAWLSEEVAQWLDDEWIERSVHRDIGSLAGKLIEEARRAGDQDVTTLMFAVADGMAKFDFYESDVNQFDVANKVSDLLLQSAGTDVCCTQQPYKAFPGYPEDPNSVTVPEVVRGGDEGGGGNEGEAGGGKKESAFPVMLPQGEVEKWVFLQQGIDGRMDPALLNHAVLSALGVEWRADDSNKVIIDTSKVDKELWASLEWGAQGSVPDFVLDPRVARQLMETLEERLQDCNREVEDLDAVLEALLGQEALLMQRAEANPDFLARQACVAWLHHFGGY
ncbi:hypothetical protein T484DRAFT_3317679 [Baffinella frigidus]|nr:hypothetical protein T484DRAFT_3317679 [Cryptophyta sp. CCMP2293]